MEPSNEPWIYGLELYPDFELVTLLADDYDLVGTFDSCNLHVRRE